MEAEISWPYLQEPSIKSCPEPHESSPHIHAELSKIEL
jgi:hypothetical protein